MNFNERYNRNMKTISQEDNKKLRDFKVCVIGCGGIGGYVIELLGRLGIGTITAVDGDIFDITNLNRQLLSTEKLMGTSKALAAKLRMAAINSGVNLMPVVSFITPDNCEEIIAGHDIIVDALDNISVRKLLEKNCEELNIPLVYGAIAGWYGYVSTIMPGDRTIEKLYPGEMEKGAEQELGNPSFTPALVASIEVAEIVKVLLGKGNILSKKLLTIDLLAQEYEICII